MTIDDNIDNIFNIAISKFQKKFSFPKCLIIYLIFFQVLRPLLILAKVDKNDLISLLSAFLLYNFSSLRLPSPIYGDPTIPPPSLTPTYGQGEQCSGSWPVFT